MFNSQAPSNLKWPADAKVDWLWRAGPAGPKVRTGEGLLPHNSAVRLGGARLPEMEDLHSEKQQRNFDQALICKDA